VFTIAATGLCPKPLESKSLISSLKPILIVSSHQCLCHLSGLFPSGFPTKILYVFIISAMRAVCPDHPILLDLVTEVTFAEECQLLLCL